MSKEEIDIEFVKIIPMINKIALGLIYKKGKNHLDQDGVVNEAYLYLLQNKNKVKTQDEMQRLVINWIKQNIGWQNSQLNIKNKVNTITEHFQPEEEIDDEFDIENKINIENWWNEKLSILEMYRQQEDDKIYQIIFDLYFIKGFTIGIKLAKELHISNCYGSMYIRNLHERIRIFEKNNNNK